MRNTSWINSLDPRYFEGSTPNARLPDYSSYFDFQQTIDSQGPQQVASTQPLQFSGSQITNLNPGPEFKSSYVDRTQSIALLQPSMQASSVRQLEPPQQDFNLPDFSFDFSGLGLNADGLQSSVNTQPNAQTPEPGFGLNQALGLGSLASNLLGGAAPAVAAGAYAGYQQLTGLGDLIEGDKLTTPQKVALFPLTGGLSLFSDQIQSLFGSGASEEDLDRREVNELLKERGVLGEDYNLTLQDGTVVDFDNPMQVQNFGQENIFNPDDSYLAGLAERGTRANYELDPTNPLSSQAAAYLNPLGEILSREADLDLSREKLVGWLSNAILGSGNVQTEMQLMDEIRSLYDQLGINNETGIEALQGYGLDDDTFNIFGHDLNLLFR